MTDWRYLITAQPDKLGGQRCADVLEYLASGMSVAEVMSEFPDLTREDVLAYGAACERATMQLHA